MRVIVVFAVLIATVVVGKNYCVNLVKDDKSCDGFSTNWPAKACSSQQTDFQSSAVCDNNAFYSFYDIWKDLCPKKNSGNQTFCEGKGYYLAYSNLTSPCLLITPCTTDADCNPVQPPVDNSPAALPPHYCYDCCQFCFDDVTCDKKVALNDAFTKSTTCTPCKPAEHPSNPGGSDSKLMWGLVGSGIAVAVVIIVIVLVVVIRKRKSDYVQV